MGRCLNCVEFKELPAAKRKHADEYGSTVCLIGIKTQPQHDHCQQFLAKRLAEDDIPDVPNEDGD